MARHLAALVALALGAIGPAAALGADEQVLSAEFLLGDEPLAGPVAMTEYAVSPVARLPQHRSSGRLRLDTSAAATGFTVLEDEFGRLDQVGAPIRYLPPFDFRYVQEGWDLVPLARRVLRSEHPYWELILQPGLAWQAAADGGWTRASLPFALQERAANCTHYGVLTWLFDASGEVSRAAWQIASETCAYFRFDAWGVVNADYQALDPGEEAAAALARLRDHDRARLPVRPLSRIDEDYPGVDHAELGFADGLEAADLTLMGMLVDGIHYQSDCPTRQGLYPYCTTLPLPSYSTAKSIFAGVGLMRLEQMHPGSSRMTLASLIDECSGQKWRDVTVEDALDMATGNYDSTAMYEDEDASGHLDFIFAAGHAEKLRLACRLFGRHAEPGTRFVYHTSDTYLVGVALQRLIDRREGRSDLYEDVLLDDIWKPLQLSPLLDGTKRTYDAAAQPFSGYGLTYEADDILRIAGWLVSDGGRIGDERLLDRTLLEAALQRRPEDRGLKAGGERLRYNNGFWAWEAGTALGCEHEVWVPFMSGFGGITVAMFPNGVIYYYYSDGHLHRWQSGREAAHTIVSLCRGQD